ncbi:hypothetical protein [Flavobacterium saccharophilum]|nr:hypothetical protein [Flavobacterium saccharophilum]
MQQQQQQRDMARNLNNIQTAEEKLANEERKLKKLQTKSTEKEADLKANLQELASLESKANNNTDIKKEIEKSKKRVQKSEEKVAKSESELEKSSNKIQDLQNKIQAAKIQKEELIKKHEEEKRVKEEEKAKKEKEKQERKK